MTKNRGNNLSDIPNNSSSGYSNGRTYSFLQATEKSTMQSSATLKARLAYLNKLNSLNKSWTATLYPEFLGKTVQQLNKFAGRIKMGHLSTAMGIDSATGGNPNNLYSVNGGNNLPNNGNDNVNDNVNLNSNLNPNEGLDLQLARPRPHQLHINNFHTNISGVNINNNSPNNNNNNNYNSVGTHINSGSIQPPQAIYPQPLISHVLLSRHNENPILKIKEFNWLQLVRPSGSQGNCGSCYAFATIRMAEARLKLRYKHDVSLSVQHPLDCAFYNQGCDGGYPFLVMKFANEFELVPDSCHSYTVFSLSLIFFKI